MCGQQQSYGKHVQTPTAALTQDLLFLKYLLHLKVHSIGPVLHHVRAAILWGNSLDTSASKKPQNVHIRFTTKVPDEPWAHLVAVQSEVDDIMGLQATAASIQFSNQLCNLFLQQLQFGLQCSKKLNWLWVLGIIYSNHVLWLWKHCKARICA